MVDVEVRRCTDRVLTCRYYPVSLEIPPYFFFLYNSFSSSILAFPTILPLAQRTQIQEGKGHALSGYVLNNLGTYGFND